jgi:hypothetical protein
LGKPVFWLSLDRSMDVLEQALDGKGFMGYRPMTALWAVF